MRVEREEGTPSWRRFAELVNLRFRPPLRANPLGELVACRRTGSVSDYQEQFLTLLNRAGLLTEPQQIQLFTVGLQSPMS
uniref:Retrotransposon gag domain-containing protein n=1 Tax=Arundo donax TaxID=35708 RepID=A0A0A9C712_ARUDO